MDLEPRLLKGLQADFIQSEWPGRNTSGLQPYGKNVLVRMDECAVATTGGVLLTDDKIDSMTAASETGCIYAVGVQAFHRHDDGSLWVGDKPQPGDRVYVARYSGQVCKGRDGGVYRIMGYECVVGGLDKAWTEEPEGEA